MSDPKDTGTIVPFQYGDSAVRTITINGEPWFVLADLCAVLGIANPSAVAQRLDPTSVNTLRLNEGNRGNPNVTIVNEAGMYEVVLRSDKPEAATFRRWLTADVLPALRKTGSYGTVPALTEDEIVHQALQIQGRKIEALTAKVEELAPPAKAWNNLAAASGNYSVAEAAKILSQDPAISIGRDRLFTFMSEQGWIFRSRNSRGGWEVYQTQVDNGRLYERPARPFLNEKTGEYELPAPTVRVTVKGIEKLRVLLGGSEGLIALPGGAA